MHHPTDRFNVIVILIDDLGWGELGCYGNAYNESPHMDSLARSGLRFTDAYASSTVCSPSRAGLLTGQAPPRNGITDYLRPESEWYLPLNPAGTAFADRELPEDTSFHLDPAMVTMADLFRNSGYHTSIIGKWHLSGYDAQGVKFGPDKYGFEEVIMSEQVGIQEGSYFWPYLRIDPAIRPLSGDSEYLIDRMNHEAVSCIKRQAHRPFFLYLSHYAVHTALAAKRPDVEHFQRKSGAGRHSDGRTEWTRHNNPVLAAMLRSVDEGVGMIRRTLEELGLADSTLIVLTSDNGGDPSVTRNAHLRLGKSSTYEGGLRVPLIMSWPQRIAAGGTCTIPTINLDFYPTFAELLQASIPAAHVLDGLSMVSLLDGEAPVTPQHNRQLFWHYPLAEPHFLGGRSSCAMREEDWKLIAFLDRDELELYDLCADGGESRNLAALHPGRAARQRAALAAWLQEVQGQIPAGQRLAHPPPGPT